MPRSLSLRVERVALYRMARSQRLVSLLNYLLNSCLTVVLLHVSNFDSAHDDVEGVWFELWVNGRLW